MPNISKPGKLNLLWASGGDILDPGDTKYQTGWGVEVPPRQWENYIQNKQDQAIAHINQHGIAGWDAETEYQAGKSYVQSLMSGEVYRSKVTHSGQDPELDTTGLYWDIAFPSFDSVYPKTEVYNKVEIDGKTTVATEIEARAQTNNEHLLTPLRLADAFKSTKQNLGASGFQELPGGLILQWFRGSLVGNKVDFPKPFPTNLFVVVPTDDLSNNPVSWNSSLSTRSTAHINAATADETVSFIALGN